MKKLDKNGGFNFENKYCIEKPYVRIFPLRRELYNALLHIEEEINALLENVGDAPLVLSYFFRMMYPDASDASKAQAERILYTILGAIENQAD